MPGVTSETDLHVRRNSRKHR